MTTLDDLNPAECRALLAVGDGGEYTSQGPKAILRRLCDQHGLIQQRRVTPGCLCGTCRDVPDHPHALCDRFILTGAGSKVYGDLIKRERHRR